MLKNYFIISYRHLMKNRLISMITILGLAISMTACLLILHYVNYEKSFDRVYPNYRRIYRIRYDRSDHQGQYARFASCCPPAALMIRSHYPEVEHAARIFRFTGSISHADQSFIEERIFFAEPQFFSIFALHLIQGRPGENLQNPNTALISKSTAIKYFGRQNPIGQVLSLDKKNDYRIVGVYEDNPSNSHLKMDIILSFANIYRLLGDDIDQSWGDTGFFTYILFTTDADPQAFETKLNQEIARELGEMFQHYKIRIELDVQPLEEIHLTSHYMQEYEVNGDADTVRFLSIIALFIVIIAAVNYINLSTARALTRARETGLRKVVGATRRQLITQFFFETVVTNGLSMGCTLVMILLIQSQFNRFSGLPPQLSIFDQSWFWMVMPALFLISIILSGFYPVIVLSSYQPKDVLKGKLGNSVRGISLRKILVVGQFAIAIILLTLTVTVFRQLSFMKSRELGFRKDQIMVIRLPRVRSEGFPGQLAAFREELVRQFKIDRISVVTEVPGKQIYWDAGDIHRVGTDQGKNYQIVGVDYDFIPVFRLSLVAGRNFSKDYPADSMGLILNETAVKWMGFPDIHHVVGEKVSYWDEIYTVIGVLKDYHQQSAKAAFEPHLYRLTPYGRGVRGFITIPLPESNPQPAIQAIPSLFASFFPGNPFDHFFLDEYFNRQYQSDERFGIVFGTFSLLAILVTCLGILGLSSFMVLQRTKEIGIRKVLGAGLPQMIWLLMKEYIGLMAVSFLTTLPVSYWLINRWLETFARKMTVSPFLFLCPLMIVAFFMIVTVMGHVLKASLSNPLSALRYE
ncbi:MAG: ABC transporter permease [Candidatus Delongbacteria bacterium]|nr:ABC transporter permease [Candidatus Delongbacteria bacterium]